MTRLTKHHRIDLTLVERALGLPIGAAPWQMRLEEAL